MWNCWSACITSTTDRAFIPYVNMQQVAPYTRVRIHQWLLRAPQLTHPMHMCTLFRYLVGLFISFTFGIFGIVVKYHMVVGRAPPIVICPFFASAVMSEQFLNILKPMSFWSYSRLKVLPPILLVTSGTSLGKFPGKFPSQYDLFWKYSFVERECLYWGQRCGQGCWTVGVGLRFWGCQVILSYVYYGYRHLIFIYQHCWGDLG